MEKDQRASISDELREKILQVKTKQNELLEVDVTMSEKVDFTSIKAMEFIVGIGEFIDSIPCLFSESIDETNRFYRFFYTIPLGNRKHFEDLIYNRFFNDEELENLSITFTPEEFKTPHLYRVPKKEINQHHIMHIEFNKLDKSNKLITELNICTARFQDLQQQLRQISNQSELDEFEKLFSNATQSLIELTTSLHKNSINMQMLPLHTLTGKYRRIVYDYCQSSGKQIKLEVNNASIQLDKRIIDKLDEPLVHIIRNAMDHGIESPEERVKNGKTPEGTITITGSNRGEKAIIEVTDDGAGLDPEKIRATCLKKSLFSDEKIGAMQEHELYQCLFMPGFSTARIITDISGRGVGLDVVYTAIKEMHGKINLYSTPGQGTNIKLTLPETLSLIKTIFVISGRETFALPSKSIIKILNSYEIDCTENHPTACLTYQEQTIPIYPLNHLFSHEAYIDDDSQDNSCIDDSVFILAKTEDNIIALKADRIVDMRDVVVKPFGSYLGSIPGYGGAIICGDGSIVYLIDTSSIHARIDEYEQR